MIMVKKKKKKIIMAKKKKMMIMFKKMIIVKKEKTITYKIKFIDSYRFMKANYQTLLITYLTLTIKNANQAWKEKKSNHNAIFLSSKIELS